MSIEDRIMAEAANWHMATESDAMDWDGFTRWLEADPAHRCAYDEIALTDGLLQDHRDSLGEALRDAGDLSAPSQAVANDTGNEPSTIARGKFPRRLFLAATAVAAALAAVIAVPQFATPAAQTYVSTDTARQIALEDGSSVTLAPRSRLSIEGRNQDRMALSGGALFDIRHDPDRPLTITAGDLRISDIGTRFDVQAEEAHVRVAVVEGTVNVISESGTSVELPAGKGLSFDRRGGNATVASVRAEDVGSWRQGRLSYDSAPLSLVIADLHRYAGVRVDMPDAIGDRRFSGTLTVGDGNAALRDLAQVMGLRLDGRAGAWHLRRSAD